MDTQAGSGFEFDDDLIDELKLRTQPTWQLALELSVLKKKLKYVENEINVLGEGKSSRKAVKSRDLIREKISALQKELETRKESSRRTHFSRSSAL